MGEFFHGWRKKMGVVTLVMALVLLGGWVRSKSMVDIFYAYDKQSMFGLGSFAGRLTFFRSDRIQGNPTPFWRKAPLHRYHGFHTGAVQQYDPMDGHATDWRWDLYGFHIGAGVSTENPIGIRIEQCIVPYGFLVWPLTLISAILLLSKPRSLPHQKTVEPIPGEGT